MLFPSRRSLVAGAMLGFGSTDAGAQDRPRRNPNDVQQVRRVLLPEERGSTLREICERLTPLLAVSPKTRFESDTDFDGRVSLEPAKLGVQLGQTQQTVRLDANLLRIEYDANNQEVLIGSRAHIAGNRLPWNPARAIKSDRYGPVRLAPFLTEHPYFYVFDSIADLSYVNHLMVTRYHSNGQIFFEETTRGPGYALSLCKSCVGPSRSETFRMSRAVAEQEFDQMEVIIEGVIVSPGLHRGLIRLGNSQYFRPNISDRLLNIMIEIKILWMTTRSFTFIGRRTGQIFHRVVFSRG